MVICVSQYTSSYPEAISAVGQSPSHNYNDRSMVPRGDEHLKHVEFMAVTF